MSNYKRIQSFTPCSDWEAVYARVDHMGLVQDSGGKPLLHKGTVIGWAVVDVWLFDGHVSDWLDQGPGEPGGRRADLVVIEGVTLSDNRLGGLASHVDNFLGYVPRGYDLATAPDIEAWYERAARYGAFCERRAAEEAAARAQRGSAA